MTLRCHVPRPRPAGGTHADTRANYIPFTELLPLPFRRGEGEVRGGSGGGPLIRRRFWRTLRRCARRGARPPPGSLGAPADERRQPFIQAKKDQMLLFLYEILPWVIVLLLV